jgi:hypothetical protein
VRLAAEGESVRAIAVAVFGDVRRRGRVERILRRPTVPEAPAPDEESAELERQRLLAEGGEMAVVEELLARYERSLLASRERPSLPDLERLIRIRSQLANLAQVERLNALTRQAE